MPISSVEAYRGEIYSSFYERAQRDFLEVQAQYFAEVIDEVLFSKRAQNIKPKKHPKIRWGE